MPAAAADVHQDIRQAFDDLLGLIGDRQADAFTGYLELEKKLIEQYQQYIDEERATERDPLQQLTKYLMTSSLHVLAFQRETRSRVLDLHSQVAAAHLKLLERLREKAAAAGTAPPTGRTADRKKERPRGRRRR